MVERPQMLVEEFEHLARHSGETVTLEFLYGKLGVKAVPDGDHCEIVRWIARQLLPLRGEFWLYQEIDLKVERYRNGRARADGVLAPDGSFTGQGNWVDPAPILLVVEVTSYDRDTDRRDRVEKPAACAEAGIPVYLLIDRDSGESVVFSHPDDGVYTSTNRYRFGKTVELPDPVGVSFDTEPLQGWVR
ncbi:Uma2 family endonuclease [Nocardia sp. NBC_00508]|uniref:Uma2 family endonuclease n=1 Tax=Nocardia sp. NBC_00508 TaxID=2975992 RepID=UPI002E81EBE7|nr:Uma2 family endonuclease [Nocardia sp. NBC_00508]WUD65376.1 Uma2 family endonuclease [Nocardia sp. NBC_00508]